MLKLFRKTKQLAVDFCDRCARVCDAACRRSAIVERARERWLADGVRFR